MMIKILGVKIDNINYNQTIDKIDSFVKSKKPHHIVTVNPEIIMRTQKDKEYQKIINNSDLNVADGAGLIWAAKYLKQKLDCRVTGIDLIDKICDLANKKQYSIFFLGGQNKAGEMAAKKLKNRYQKLKIAGIYEGFPIIKDNLNNKDKINNLSIIQQVAKTKPDILLVAYGAPKQEKFISKYKNELNVSVIIGIGGAFDFISGKIKRAPNWMRKIHLEWLYRLIQQPSRLNRIITATIRFPLIVIFKKHNLHS